MFTSLAVLPGVVLFPSAIADEPFSPLALVFAEGLLLFAGLLWLAGAVVEP